MDSKLFIDSLYPSGWSIAEDSDLDNFNQATADNMDLMIEEMAKLSTIRNPLETPVLSDLEKEYGIIPDADHTEETRRMILNNEKNKRISNAGVDRIREELVAAGFENVFIYENDPAVDPRTLVTTTNFMTCDSDNAYCDYEPLPGEQAAVCGILESQGYVLANGPIYNIVPRIASVCDDVFCDNGDNNFCDFYEDTVPVEIPFPITADINRWAHFLFVGGIATRNAQGGITSVGEIPILNADRERFERIFLKFKPLDKWCIMSIVYT